MTDPALIENIDALTKVATALATVAEHVTRLFVEVEELREGLAELDAKLGRHVYHHEMQARRAL